MVGESSALTSPRTVKKSCSARRLKSSYTCEKMYFRGAAGSARACTSIVEVDGPGDVPAIPQFPRSAPVNVTAVAHWSDAAAAYVTAEYVAQAARRDPRGGGGHVSDRGKRSTPNPNYPTVIDEAVAQTFQLSRGYLSRGRRNTSDISDGNAPSITGAMMRSGAAECIEAHSQTGDLRWLGSSARPSIAPRHGRGSERRARRRRAVCVRTAAGTDSKHITKSHFTLAVLPCPT